MNCTIHKDERAFIVTKSEVQNPELSFGARGVWVYILSLPDIDPLTTEDLINKSPDTPADIKTYLQELENASYIVTEVIL